MAYAVLSFVIEAATNMTFSDYVSQNILTPLGMVATSPGQTPEAGTNGFIAQNDTWWDGNLGLMIP
jgi:CubicO group peptidase (beta-lactamase class C family)